MIFKIVAAAYLEGLGMEIRTSTLRNKKMSVVPPKVVDEGVGRYKQSFHKRKPFFVLEGAKGGNRARVEHLVHETAMLPKPRSTKRRE